MADVHHVGPPDPGSGDRDAPRNPLRQAPPPPSENASPLGGSRQRTTVTCPDGTVHTFDTLHDAVAWADLGHVCLSIAHHTFASPTASAAAPDRRVS
jgi:hypothetical protein